MLKRCTMLLVVIVLLGGSFSTLPPEAQNTPSTPTATSSLIVKLIDGLSLTQQAAVIARNGGIEVSVVPALRLHIVEVQTADLSTILQRYRSDSQVESVE